MRWVEEQLNNSIPKMTKEQLEYSPAVSSETRIRMSDKTAKAASQIKLGDKISTGTVVGLIQKKVMNTCKPTPFEAVCQGACMWDSEAVQWRRVGDIYPSEKLSKDHIFYSFVVTPTAQIELESGHRIRDYIEVHSPETEHVYAQKIAESGSHA